MGLGTGKDQYVQGGLVAQSGNVRPLSVLRLEFSPSRVDRAGRGNDLGHPTVSDVMSRRNIRSAHTLLVELQNSAVSPALGSHWFYLRPPMANCEYVYARI